MVYREIVLDALRELADPEVRARRWRSSGPPEVSSFEECVCRLFDDSGLGDALDRSELVFSERIDRELALLRRVLRSVDSRRPSSDVLADPLVVESGVRAAGLLVSLDQQT